MVFTAILTDHEVPRYSVDRSMLCVKMVLASLNMSMIILHVFYVVTSAEPATLVVRSRKLKVLNGTHHSFPMDYIAPVISAFNLDQLKISGQPQSSSSQTFRKMAPLVHMVNTGSMTLSRSKWRPSIMKRNGVAVDSQLCKLRLDYLNVVICCFFFKFNAVFRVVW